jgi:NAD(P)-dependent dehydrogenase (short-subunit alcohol dehydrogenase family)
MSATKAKSTAVVVGVGAERGLGAALCRRFAAEGYHVLVAGRTPEKIAQVAKTISATGGSAEAAPVDTTREDDVIRLFDRAMSPGDGREPADVVIFNAGNNRRIDFRELSAEQFEQFWRIGCFGGFLVGREAARRLAPLGRGTIIFTHLHRRLRQPARQARVCAIRRRESRPAHDRAEHGAGVRAARTSCRACGDRWRDQRRSAA